MYELILASLVVSGVDFVRDVQPILTASCLECHGPAKQRGGLRLDNRIDALQGGNSGPVLKPGDPRGSRLLTVVAGMDADTKMPPKGRALTPAEIATLRAWIEEGLPWPDAAKVAVVRDAPRHWAYTAPQRPPVPPGDHPIDAFIRVRLRQEQLLPNQPADRVTLLRRASFDLTGLPPTPAEVAAFLADQRPGAWTRVVERLLASPHYGERWARHWLDLARYADSDGFEKDTGRPHAWRYRHWVIQAFNRDLPFDQFTIEQLAGDLLPNATIEQKVATGFHRNTLTNKEGGVDKEQFRVEQVVDRVNTTAKVFLGSTLGCAQCHDHKYDPFSQREYYQLFAFFNSDEEVDLAAPVSAEEERRLGERKEGTKAQTIALGKGRPTHVLIRGDFLRPGVPVQPGTPGSLPPLDSAGTANRLDLARWLVQPDHPLTSRVIVNWIWSRHFGRGLVPTLDDFGTQGEKPSHPELLDWLATEFVRQDWSLKVIHRLILTSATYQQASDVRPDAWQRDPVNVLLARQSRLRLEAETLRDNALAVSGLLQKRLGGPSVRPPQPAGIAELTYANSAKWVESKGPDRYRRGLYTWFQRTSPYPMLMTFDAPDSNVCSAKRDRSNTPLQALTLLNDPVFAECAQALGSRILAELPNGDDQERLRHGFRLCVARMPDAGELAALHKLLLEFRAATRTRPKAEAAAWSALARTLLNLDEFVTRE